MEKFQGGFGMGGSYLLGTILFSAVLGIIPALIVRSKSRKASFIRWWLYGATLFVIALPHSLLFKPKEADVKADDDKQRRSWGLRKCPYCSNWIMKEADVCKFCGKDLPPHWEEFC